MTAFQNKAVADVFKAYPKAIQKRLLSLRQLIFETAEKTQGVGKLEETLKWGEPAYLTAQSKAGSTIRIHQRKSKEDEYAIYFNCQTNLIETFKALFPNRFRYEGNRAIVFRESEETPIRELSLCIALALTYHQKKKS